ncbi:hypothetical protein PPYR_15034 [Photinus pyralis]|uniref:VOC domain-containing protein n=1 Tax=Photinus pyralis TaxID=7054 RepID=A0A5N3ZZS2_PHOPY|nr:glyoxalase domain-containing protein 4-like [Photinus pyralis]KAB0790562.1 hypothetical protein PPYR_15034 [Photinus pyralis]
MAGINGRALHYVFKDPNRKLSTFFYKNVLGMKILRHEEFSEGCEAACNGPYANRWSKSMIGYGPEDKHFVVELTYNYPIKSYKKGNDFIGITIKSKEVLERAKAANWPILAGNVLEAPGGYKFFIKDEPQPSDRDPIEKVTIACSSLAKSLDYWNGILGLTVFEKSEKSATVGFKANEAKLELHEIDEPIDRAEAYGRIAFSCPFEQQLLVDEKIRKSNNKILTPLLYLDTPGKKTVRVIILADPNDHEICFVEDEGFRELSQVDEGSDALLERYLAKDNQ